MKKYLHLILMIFLTVCLVSCVDEVDEDSPTMDNIINIYAINDFHGAIFENTSNGEIGISKLGNYLINEKQKHPENTVIISAGDMFQGTAVSSLTRGRIVVDLMNKIGFDAMVVGNHEFDFGVSEIIRYVDGDEENGEMHFPLLAANIYHKPSGNYVDWAKPYTIIERNGIKIGILGLIGKGLTSSILGSISKDYEFTDELEMIKKYVPILRKDEGANIVIVVSHSDTSLINEEVKNLTGYEYVDAMINGHTHQYYVYEETRGDYPPLVVIQSGSNGKYLGQISLTVDLNYKYVTDATVGFVNKNKLNTPSPELEEIIASYQEYIDLENEYFGKSGTYVNKTMCLKYASNVLKNYLDSDIGIINSGGIRKEAFPINANEDITYGKIFKMIPFENKVITLELSGKYLKRLIDISELEFSDSLDLKNFKVNGKPIEDFEYYKISVIDYVYYRYEYIFEYGKKINFHEVIFRDLLVAAVKANIEQYGKWNLK